MLALHVLCNTSSSSGSFVSLQANIKKMGASVSGPCGFLQRSGGKRALRVYQRVKEEEEKQQQEEGQGQGQGQEEEDQQQQEEEEQHVGGVTISRR